MFNLFVWCLALRRRFGYAGSPRQLDRAVGVETNCLLVSQSALRKCVVTWRRNHRLYAGSQFNVCTVCETLMMLLLFVYFGVEGRQCCLGIPNDVPRHQSLVRPYRIQGRACIRLPVRKSWLSTWWLPWPCRLNLRKRWGRMTCNSEVDMLEEAVLFLGFSWENRGVSKHVRVGVLVLGTRCKLRWLTLKQLNLCHLTWNILRNLFNFSKIEICAQILLLQNRVWAFWIFSSCFSERFQFLCRVWILVFFWAGLGNWHLAHELLLFDDFRYNLLCSSILLNQWLLRHSRLLIKLSVKWGCTVSVVVWLACQLSIEILWIVLVLGNLLGDYCYSRRFASFLHDL